MKLVDELKDVINKLEGNEEDVKMDAKPIESSPAPVEKPALEPAKSDIERLADEVMRGAHGSGRELMITLGDKYAAVQAEVNKRIREGAVK